MVITFSEDQLRTFLDQVSFREHGDSIERKHGSLVTEHFPNCEKFWKSFVVPTTHRIEPDAELTEETIRFREGIYKALEEISSAHYSMFVNLVDCHQHLIQPVYSSWRDVYIHMASACELSMTVIEELYLLFLSCQGKPSKILQELTREEFLVIADAWYTKYYPSVYQYYLVNGRANPFRLISRDNILAEYLQDDGGVRVNFIHHYEGIRDFRNAIVHAIIIGRIIDQEKGYLIPKPNVVKENYRTWRAVADAANNPDIVAQNFVEWHQQASQDLQQVEELLNALWDRIISDFEAEFFSTERDLLRQKFCIELIRKNEILTGIPGTMPITNVEQSIEFTSESGTARRPPEISSAVTTINLGSSCLLTDRDNEK